MQVEGTRLYRVRDVAEHFDVSVATIYRAIESGQLKALKLGTGTGTFRVSGAAVLAYAESCLRAAYRSWFPADVSDDPPTGDLSADQRTLVAGGGVR
jgi:excisionase family DNA binding protein